MLARRPGGRWLSLAFAAALLAAAGPAVPASAGRKRITGGLNARPLNASCRAPASGGATPVAMVPALGGVALSDPTAAAQSPLGTQIWYVTERAGTVERVDGVAGAKSVALDLSARVYTGGEGGLLGIALHPGFAQNGYLFVYYTPFVGSNLHSVVSRFTSTDGGATFDPASERVVLDLTQPYIYHLGGDIHFGPDAKLYVGFGDGETDPDTAQDPYDWHGKLLRLDVDSGNPYAIPPDNPYASGGGAPEVWALGFRNPFRWSFDRLTGALWLGDVGENDWEEVDLVVRGGNYGWPSREGHACRLADTCDNPAFLPPEFDYSHADGCAILGGFVYRGAALPALAGAYLYGDYCSMRIWSALLQAGGGGYQIADVMTSPEIFSSFAQGSDGEVLVLRSSGAFRLAPASSTTTGSMPLHLADTGCVSTSDPKQPAGGLIPYDVIQSLWSDGAAKQRWLALPDGAEIHVEPDGDFTLPPGSVTMKNFMIGGQIVETRFFVRYGDGTYGGYSYEWNDAQTDAVLLSGADQREWSGRTWTYPSRPQCLECHTPAAGYSLGLEEAQLNRDFLYTKTGRTANELATFASIGLFDSPLPTPVGALPRLEKDTLDHRVRTYLHANCSGCHRPGGGTVTAMDLRYAASTAGLGLCNVDPSAGDLGVTGAKLLWPGDPSLSLISLRLHRVGSGQMPPLARSLVDASGTTNLDDWIRSWVSCTGPDSDGDGVVDAADDCPATPNASQTDANGNGIGDACETACNDGVDNDGDGLVDYPNDPGCRSAASTSESPACNDGVDDDGDGFTDGPADVGCAGTSGAREDPPCADGIDNDGDGLVDFDGGKSVHGTAIAAPDPDCAGNPTGVEGRHCGLGFEVAPLLVALDALRRRRRSAARL